MLPPGTMEISTHKPLARVMPGLVTLWRLGSGVTSVNSVATEVSVWVHGPASARVYGTSVAIVNTGGTGAMLC